MMGIEMLISITVVVIILIILTIIVCRACFRKPERPVSKYLNNRSAASGDHILDNTDIGRPSLSDNVCSKSKSLTPQEDLFANPFDQKDILRKKVASNLIANTNRLSEPTPSTSRVLSRFLAQHDDHIHAGVVVCCSSNATKDHQTETKITVFDKALSQNTVKRISRLFEQHESAKKCPTKPTFINILSESEFDLIENVKTPCVNRKLSIDKRTSENSGLKLPLDSLRMSGRCLCDSSSGNTIYGDTSVFQFIETIPNELLTNDLIKELEG